ncbi:MAG: phosphomannomutase/phosphoglucomutase [Planctomycetes bacterium]|nr:phosphomannomutase/phosphoglucomutase [Planctomycetota bacterium]
MRSSRVRRRPRSMRDRHPRRSVAPLLDTRPKVMAYFIGSRAGVDQTSGLLIAARRWIILCPGRSSEMVSPVTGKDAGMLSKVFKAYDIRGIYPDPLNEKVAWKVGYATAKFLKQKLSGRDAVDPMLQHIVVGRDMRPHSPKLAKALIDGIRAAEMNVFDVGMVDTSFIYFAINHLGCGGGIQTTASHNPIEYNGFKISGQHASPIGSATGLVEIQRLAATIEDTNMKPVGRVEERDLWADYVAHVRKFLNLKRPLKVVVDASNGMAGAFVPRIFQGIPGLEIIPINFEITGKFTHDPNPLVPENMQPTVDGVLKHKADLGCCFDGDADRCILCDENGKIIGCDLLGALFAIHFLKQSPGSAIIYDLRSSKALEETIKEHGGKPVRGRVGHVFLKQLMRENDGVFGAELSGHMYYRDNFYTDSGAITFATALNILSHSDQTMSQLIKPLSPYTQSGEINFRVDDKDAAIDALRKKLDGRAKFDELDGITADAWDKEGWWLNVRKSNTEPMLRLNLEARTRDTEHKVYDEVRPILGEPAKGH